MEPLKTDKEKLQTPNYAITAYGNDKTRCPICHCVTDLSENDLKKRIASLAGSIAGAAGKGSSKTRNKSHYQKMAKIRWAKTKLKNQSQKSTSLKMRQPK